MDLLGGGGSAQQQNPFGGSTDIFGGGAAASGGDLFGEMQSSAPTFPEYIAFEDSVIKIGFSFKRDMMARNNHTITAVFQNKTGSPVGNISMQVAAQKYMVLKI